VPRASASAFFLPFYANKCSFENFCSASPYITEKQTKGKSSIVTAYHILGFQKFSSPVVVKSKENPYLT
jgi:predicted nucleic acid-binding Zn finger protein